MGNLIFQGSEKSTEVRPKGEKILLGSHVDEIEAALGISMNLGSNALLHDIRDRNAMQQRVECYKDPRLEVNLEQCIWCKSKRECARKEEDEFTGRVEIDTSKVEKSDKEKLEKFLESELFDTEEEDGVESEFSKNLSFFLFDKKSPFVFSDTSEFTKKMVCRPLFSTTVIQPISEERTEKRHLFSPKLAYCPPLKRNLTIFETQILNALDIKGGEVGADSGGSGFHHGKATCEDFLKQAIEVTGDDTGSSLRVDIRNSITQEGDGGSEPYWRLRRLMDTGGEGVTFIPPDWPEGVELDFFEGWADRGSLGPREWVVEKTICFLEDLCEAISDSQGRIHRTLREAPFVESRISGVIIQGDDENLPTTTHSGVRIVREAICEGLSKPYLLIDSPDFFSSDEEIKENYTNLADSPDNREILRILNRCLDERGRDERFFESLGWLPAARSGKSGYVLFDDFEYRSAASFHDVIRGQQRTTDYKNLKKFFNFLGKLAQRAVEEGGEEIRKVGKDFQETVSSEGFASEPNPLKIIEGIGNMGPNFSEIVRLEIIEDVRSPMVTEVVKFFDYGGISVEGERKATEKGVTIEFKRERPKTDSDYKQVRRGGESRRSIPKFTIDSDLKEFTWGRSTRIFLQNYLSTGSAVHSERTPIIGGLYLTSAVRSKVTESRDSAFGVQYPVAKEIVKWLREWAHFRTLFFAMGNEKDHFEYKRDVERVFPANNSEAGPEVAIYCWNTTRSPIEARNLMFTEVR